jgi:hypothetical protein
VRALVHQPVIAAIAARLSRSRVIRVWDDQLVSKPPSDGAGGGGGRLAFGPGLLDDLHVAGHAHTAWFPLHDCPAEMGPVVYIDGSHRWPSSETMRHFNTDDLDALQQRTMGPAIEPLKRAIAIEKGQLSFHHSRLIHGSGVNQGSFPRTSIALHLQDERNRYRIYRNERGEPWHLPNDDLCRWDHRGLPDYTDPAVFPVLYTQGTA